MIAKTTCGKASAVAVVLLIVATALTIQSGCSASRRPPRLAVILVVDMFPADYMARWGEHFGTGGFKRLVNSGAEFTNAYFTYAVTTSAPGHATIVTGAVPSEHGITTNRWYRPGSNQPINCVDDEHYMTIGHIDVYDSQGFSPNRLVASTIGDELKRKYGDQAKVWSTSLKPRTAVTAAGKSADGAVWFTPKSGDFVTSTFYHSLAPAWMTKLNEQRFGDQFLNKSWDRLLPEEAYAKCDVDNAPYEVGSRMLWLNTMPKTLGLNMDQPSRLFYEQLRCSPFGNDLVFESARQIVVNESLGGDDIPDLLIVSLSSVDYCGHTFGPDSHEMLDMMARTDRQVAAWLDFLDAQIGPDQYIVLLTGDHGVSPAPERAQRAGLGGGRINLTEMFKELNNALVEEFGPTDEKLYYLTTIEPPWVYLNEQVLRFHKADLDKAAELVAQVAQRHEGVNTALVTSRVRDKAEESRTPLEKAVANSIYENRTGHVYLHVEPYWFAAGVCTGHGTFHDYDTHVPVVFSGQAFRSGTYSERIAMTDLAVTLSKVLGTESPSHASGRVLEEALVK